MSQVRNSNHIVDLMALFYIVSIGWVAMLCPRKYTVKTWISAQASLIPRYMPIIQYQGADRDYLGDQA